MSAIASLRGREKAAVVANIHEYLPLSRPRGTYMLNVEMGDVATLATADGAEPFGIGSKTLCRPSYVEMQKITESLA